jgi:FkbM family methyltransferase
MTFISYAQNSEDVLLWRALGHVKNGYYIDVGANDPVEHSVTKAFYDAGWSGISIEPLPSFHQAFLNQRPRDVNLAVAAGAVDGELTLYDVPAVRGWASPERAVAEAHQAEGYAVAEIKVPVRTLASVCAEHVRGEIHFLKIDVEGFEGEVLRGMDFARWRPWVLVIEATLPNSRETNHQTWEALVTDQGYRFVWFDGLNRYYVAAEHAELMDAFGIQPNVFDAFISHHLDKAWAANRIASDAAAALDQRLVQASAQQQAAERRADQAASRQQAAEQRADQSAALAHEALAHSRDLLARYDDANRRAELEQRARLAAQADKLRLEEELAATEARARAEVAALSGERDALRHGLDQLAADAHRTSQWAHDLEQRILSFEASTSWRVTRPLRTLGRLTHALRRPNLARRVVLRLTASERLRRLIIPVLLRYPGLRRRVSALLSTIKEPQSAPLPPVLAAVPEELRPLPASVRSVLLDLQRARGNHTGS